VVDTETKVKVIKDNEGEKSVIVITYQLGMASSAIVRMSNNKNEVTKAIKESGIIQGKILTKI
jgi:hypothetical protein